MAPEERPGTDGANGGGTVTDEMVRALIDEDRFEPLRRCVEALGLMADAAESAGAPDDYVDQMRNRECRSLGE